jgi:hypothetical protein
MATSSPCTSGRVVRLPGFRIDKAGRIVRDQRRLVHRLGSARQARARCEMEGAAAMTHMALFAQPMGGPPPPPASSISG